MTAGKTPLTDNPPNNEVRMNVADRLAVHAEERPDAVAVVSCKGNSQRNGVVEFRDGDSPYILGYDEATFAYLDQDANLLAHGFAALGVRPGHRIALLVKPGIEFVTLVFALLRSGATMVLVDGGLGRKNIVRCLESTSPDGFVAIPQGQALRVLMRKRFASARFNVTVGRRWFWGGETLDGLRKLGAARVPPLAGWAQAPLTSTSSPLREVWELPTTTADDLAAIVFTSGSTGPPKGVLYRHETFVTQCDEIQREYNLQPGGVDLACFPLFGLFNVACGVTTVLPEMDFSRPASCDPKKLFAAANQWQCTQSFASPAVWDKLSRHAEQTGEKIPTLREVFSCGAPVPAPVIERTLKMVDPEAELHTPYGATESLPVATIEAREILSETATKTSEGAGVCVGRKFDSIEWRVIRITDDPIATIDQTEALPQGEIGELIVRGPQVSRNYLTEQERGTIVPRGNGESTNRHDQTNLGGLSSPARHNAVAKITDGDTIWHRMGDVGYLDEQGRFWYCGRKSQRVVTSAGTLFTECVEQVCNTSEYVASSALVGVRLGDSTCAVVVVDGALYDIEDKCEQEMNELLTSHPMLKPVDRWIMYCGPLPTDIRHNSKIRREELAIWAEKQLRKDVDRRIKETAAGMSLAEAERFSQLANEDTKLIDHVSEKPSGET